MHLSSRRRFLAQCATIGLALPLTSCGTLLYPERRGQPPSGYLDAGVVALDAVGLLLFLVPGIIAFAVDFATGAIYLPPPPYYTAWSRSPRVLHVDPAHLTPQRLETILARETGQPVHLEPGTYRATRLGQIEDFTPASVKDLEAAPGVNRIIFRGTAE